MDLLRNRVFVGLAFVLLLLIGLVDYLDGPAMALSALYVLPVVVIAVAGGQGFGILGAMVAAAVELGAAIATGGLDVALSWQSLIRPIVYTVIALVVARLAEQRAAETRLLRELELEHSRVEELSRRDVTGLYNSRYFYERLGEALEEGRSQSQPLSVVALDVDNLKQINDTLGHRMGDLLIQSVADEIMEETDGTYLSARLGGDEFAVLMPNSDLESASALAERLLSNLSRKRIPGAQVVPSVSIGVASVPDGAAETEELLHRADLAMYAAKRMGGGRVVLG